MTDTRSVKRSEEDPNELLADFDELLSAPASDAPFAAADDRTGAVRAGDEAPTEGLDDLEALFDTFYEQPAAGESGPKAPAASAAETGDSGAQASSAALPAGLSEDEAAPADDGPPEVPAGAEPARATAIVEPGADGVAAEPPADENAAASESDRMAGKEAESPKAADEAIAAAQPADENASVAPTEQAGESGELRVPAVGREGAPRAGAGPGGNTEPEQPVGEKADAEPAAEVFPFVPAGTTLDDPPRRTFSESGSSAGAASGTGGGQKPAFVAGGVIALLAAGAGLLAWEAYSGVAALNERLATHSAPASATELPAAVAGMESSLDELSRRLDSLAASASGQEREFSGLRAEVQAAASRVAGLDARLEALRSRMATAAAGPSDEGADAASRAGKWAVNLASLADEASARGELARIRDMGIEAEIAPAPADGRTWYRIRVSGFDSAAAAKRYARSEAAGAGFGEAWVGRQ